MPDENDVGAPTQERDAVGDQDSSFSSKQTGWTNDLVKDVTSDFSINGGQDIIEKNQVCTRVNCTRQCYSSFLAPAQLKRLYQQESIRRAFD